ncbi:outer membrane beta-barrel protein [Curvibacter sp. RS43]|jgi:outer membrane protein|uniref:OmpW/AlkL family protein n=1 Tax=Curvibacter microcysteis TaxID=3026419 RepID=UPI00235FE97B|nr:OmpW family outer membrane protein [Curvibacter sp. RS43]MDD0810872.1 outer membrane beta-barrel protein [Curvibacter sp. RS43]
MTICKSLGGAAALTLALAGLHTQAQAQSQDYTVRVGYSNIAPNSSASDATGPFLFKPTSGVSLEVKNESTLFFSVARKIDDRFEVELALGLPPTHDVTAKLNPSIVPSHVVSAYQGQTIARIRQLAPTVFLNYSFGDSSSALRPFVGLGLNYTRFDERRSTPTGNSLNGGPTDIRLSDSWGLAAQVGLDYRINDKWSIHGSVATARVKTTLTATTAGAARVMDINFHPVVLTVAAGYRF